MVAGRTDALLLSSLCSTCVHRKRNEEVVEEKERRMEEETNMTRGSHVEVREKTENSLAMEWF